LYQIFKVPKSNHIRPHRLVTENDLKVDNTSFLLLVLKILEVKICQLPLILVNYLTLLIIKYLSPHIKFFKFISHLSGILNFCIIPFRLFISFNSFCYNWCMFIYYFIE
jgi:hypothetical protein